MDTKNKNILLKRVGAGLLMGLFVTSLALTVVWYYDGASNDAASKTVRTEESTQNLTDEQKRGIDREFATTMLDHNQQAVAMIDIELARGQSPALRVAAERMRQARTQESADITKLLVSWGESVGKISEDANSSDSDASPLYAGMATSAQLADLRTMPAQSVDERFLDLIGRSVDGSLRIASDYETSAQAAEVKALAGRIQATRTAERTILDGHAGMHHETGSHH